MRPLINVSPPPAGGYGGCFLRLWSSSSLFIIGSAPDPTPSIAPVLLPLNSVLLPAPLKSFDMLALYKLDYYYYYYYYYYYEHFYFPPLLGV